MNNSKALVANVAAGVIFLTTLLSPLHCSARFYSTLYWMNGIPQSQYGHVAQFPHARMYIGMPLVSSLYFNVANRGYARGDLLRQGTNNQRYWDVDHFLTQIKQYNLTQADVHLDLFSFGFLHERNYFSFSVTQKAKVRAGYTADLVRLATLGSMNFSAYGPAAELNDLSAAAIHYREISAGMIRQLSPGLSVGVRGKFLAGLAGAFIEESDLSLQADHLNGTTMVNANMQINTSRVDTSGIPSNFTGLYGHNLSDFGNMGFAVDAGVSLKPSGQLTFSVSLLDLGFIGWEKQVENVTVTGISEVTAIDLENLFTGDIINNVEVLADTTDLGFTSASGFKGFRYMLPPSMLVSAGLEISHNQQLSLLTQAMLFNRKIYPTISMVYNYMPASYFGLAVSYSYVHLSYSNVGLGFHVSIGPVQFYLVSDNILSLYDPYRSKMANIHTGLNLIIGDRNGKRKKHKNIPGLYCWD